MSTDQIVRETAFAMWEADGSPEGKSDEYWFRAEKFINERVAPGRSRGKGGAMKASLVDPEITAGGD